MKNILVRILLGLIVLSALVGTWAWTLDNVTDVIEKSRQTEVRIAEAGCAYYGVPHALVTTGGTYCYTTVNGTERMILLDTLVELYGEVPQ